MESERRAGTQSDFVPGGCCRRSTLRVGKFGRRELRAQSWWTPF